MLPVIVLAQLAGTSPWFAVNAVMPELQRDFGWAAADVGTLTSAVQLGFIAGTLVFALLAIADRFSARRVFLLRLKSAGSRLISRWCCGTPSKPADRCLPSTTSRSRSTHHPSPFTSAAIAPVSHRCSRTC